MAYMNPFNISNEIKNLNNIVTNLKNSNQDLKMNCSNLKDSINEVHVNKLDKIDIVNAIDEIKEEMLIMSNKIDRIIRKQFLNEIDKMPENEVFEFLKILEIDDNIINILLFLDYKTIQDLIIINIEEIKHYGIEESVLELIISKAREEMGTLV
jgi:hypothetical protein